MPRIKRGLTATAKPRHPGLTAELVAELRADRAAGQPRIEEQHFPTTSAIRVSVFWDKWAGLPDEERSEVILQAYEQVEGRAYRDRIALAFGLTLPEAHESGLLPYRVLPLLRKGDPVTAEACRDAMFADGASALFGSQAPQLRFATEEEAEAGRQRLIAAVPGSDEVWVVAQDGETNGP